MNPEHQKTIDRVMANGPAAMPSGDRLFVVDMTEVEAVKKIIVPAHPNTYFDDEEMVRLVANSFSLTLAEKIDLLMQTPAYTQQQVDEVLRILTHEELALAELNERHRLRRASIAEKYIAERQKRKEERPQRPATIRDVSPLDRATLVYRGAIKLLAPVGTGAAWMIFESLFARLAEGVERGEPSHFQGTLDELFAPELRNVALNALAADPQNDTRVLNTLVRPSLSKLRNLRQTTVYLKQTAYSVSLIIDLPEERRGRVKQKYRLGVFVQLNDKVTLFEERKSDFISLVMLRAFEHGERFLELERLDVFAPIIRRAVENSAYKDEWERFTTKFTLLVYVLGQILDVLNDEQKRDFLMRTFQFSIESTGEISEVDFTNWFIRVVQVNVDGRSESDPDYDSMSGKFRFRLQFAVWWPLEVRVLVLKTYLLSDYQQRYVLYLALLATYPAIREPVTSEVTLPPDDFALMSALEANLPNATDFVRLVEARALGWANGEST